MSKEFLGNSKVWYVTGRKRKAKKQSHGSIDTESILRRMEPLPVRLVGGGRPESNKRKH